jgi:predicted HicB family RNase H-like nuclease
MKNKKNQIEPIPEEFESYEEAAEFWDAHDTTDYLDDFQTVDVDTELKKRHYEVEIDDDIVKLLNKQAKKLGVSINSLISDMLRKQLTHA